MIEQNIIESDLLNFNDNEQMIKKELSLWRAVLIQALADLRLPNSNERYRLWRKQATEWFIEADEDFIMVCECANLSPQYIRKMAYDIIAKQKKLI